MIKAIILDFDDTLCMTMQACYKIDNALVQQLGHPSISKEIYQQTWGLDYDIATSLRAPGIDVNQFRKLLAQELPKYIQSGEYDAISDERIAVLKKLREQGKKVLVLTNRDVLELQHILHPEHKLAELVEAFYYKSNMKYHKPDPRAFAHIESEHRWKPHECVYVGDSVGDAVAAKGAGLHFIASLESGLRKKSDFKSCPVDDFIYHLSELPDAISKIDK